mmetsp:Transcript_10459/g.15287  ORF Transcript_10459/g.15287 Transcript_10459/m.15287 type:complete len:826 (+) Transcript_10459:3745-6222(+)
MNEKLNERKQLAMEVAQKEEDQLNHLDTFINIPVKYQLRDRWYDDEKYSNVVWLKDALRTQQDLNKYFHEKMKILVDAYDKLKHTNHLIHGQLKNREKQMDDQRSRFYKEQSIVQEIMYRSKKASNKKEVELPSSTPVLHDWKQDMLESKKAADLKKKGYKDERDERLKQYKDYVKTVNRKHHDEIELLHKEYRAKIERLEDQLDDQETYFTKKIETAESKLANFDELNRELANFKLEKHRLDKTNKTLMDEVTILEEQESQLQSDLTALHLDHERLKEKYATLVKNRNQIPYKDDIKTVDEIIELIQQADERVKEHERQKESLQRLLYHAQLRVEDLISNCSHLHIRLLEIDKLKDEIDSFEDRVAFYKQSLPDQVKDLQNAIDKSRINELALQEKVTQQDALIKDYKVNLDDTLAELTEVSKQRDDYGFSIESLTKVKGAYEEKVHDLENEIGLMHVHEKELKVYIASLEKRLEAAKTTRSMSYSRKKKVSTKTISDPNDFLDPPPSSRLTSESDDLKIIDKMDVFTRLQLRQEHLEKKRHLARESKKNQENEHMKRLFKTVEAYENPSPQPEVGPDDSTYWKDLRAVIQQEYDNRKRSASRMKQDLANLMGNHSFHSAKISAKEMQHEINKQIHQMNRKHTAAHRPHKMPDIEQPKKKTPQLPMSPVDSSDLAIPKLSIVPKHDQTEEPYDQHDTPPNSGRSPQALDSARSNDSVLTPRSPRVDIRPIHSARPSTSSSTSKAPSRPLTARSRLNPNKKKPRSKKKKMVGGPAVRRYSTKIKRSARKRHSSASELSSAVVPNFGPVVSYEQQLREGLPQSARI